jgi:hypothetical protein
MRAPNSTAPSRCDPHPVLTGTICCLMATVSFASALSHAGVKFLAASPETSTYPSLIGALRPPLTRHIGWDTGSGVLLTHAALHAYMQGTTDNPSLSSILETAVRGRQSLPPWGFAGRRRCGKRLSVSISDDARYDFGSAALIGTRAGDVALVEFTNQMFDAFHVDLPGAPRSVTARRCGMSPNLSFCHRVL